MLRYLCKLINKHVYNRGEKVTIWYHWPAEGRVLHMLLRMLGIDVFFIGSQTLAKDRTQILLDWDQEDHRVKVLVASVLCVGEGVDMQHGCHVAVLLSLCPNINQLVQVLGRQHRYGQKHEQTVYILTTIKTYDQINQAKAFRKMLVQLLGDASGEHSSGRTHCWECGRQYAYTLRYCVIRCFWLGLRNLLISQKSSRSKERQKQKTQRQPKRPRSETQIRGL